MFTGEFVDAEEAARIGLVNKVVPGDDLMDEAMKVARKIAGRSPLALRLSRAAIDQGLHSSFEQTLELEASHLLTCVGDGGYAELRRQKGRADGKGLDRLGSQSPPALAASWSRPGGDLPHYGLGVPRPGPSRLHTGLKTMCRAPASTYSINLFTHCSTGPRMQYLRTMSMKSPP